MFIERFKVCTTCSPNIKFVSDAIRVASKRSIQFRFNQFNIQWMTRFSAISAWLGIFIRITRTVQLQLFYPISVKMVGPCQNHHSICQSITYWAQVILSWSGPMYSTKDLVYLSLIHSNLIKPCLVRFSFAFHFNHFFCVVSECSRVIRTFPRKHVRAQINRRKQFQLHER